MYDTPIEQMLFVFHSCGGRNYQLEVPEPIKCKSPRPKPNLNSPNKVNYFEIGSDVKSFGAG